MRSQIEELKKMAEGYAQQRDEHLRAAQSKQSQLQQHNMQATLLDGAYQGALEIIKKLEDLEAEPVKRDLEHAEIGEVKTVPLVENGKGK